MIGHSAAHAKVLALGLGLPAVEMQANVVAPEKIKRRDEIPEALGVQFADASRVNDSELPIS